MFEASKRAGLEGVMAKRLDSVYEPGRRSRAWLKVKNHRRQEFVIGGFTTGEGRRAGRIGALLVGYYEDGTLRYAGHVGTGFTEQMLDELEELLRPLRRDTSPFAETPRLKNATFVEPQLVGEVEFSEWTRTGTLRQPSFKGLREDKDPRQVVREEPPDGNM
jgi:bifunctional non-homologous end joining protein LigD